MRALLGVVAVLMGCGCQVTRVQLIPQLTPVDASRPFFIYKPVKGTACGDHAVAGAMDDLWRVVGDSHGFVSAVLEQQQHGDRCATITARPISYGCTAREPKKLDVEPMHVVPGPTECTAVADSCTPDCARYALALAGGEFETRAFRERCVTRCRNTELAFLSCARAATAPTDVRRCDTMP